MLTYNDNLKINKGAPIDTRYLSSTGIPYTDVAEANSTIPISYRYKGLTVLIGTAEYWYQAGVTNSDLVVKETPPPTGTTNIYDGANPSNITVGGLPSGTTLTGRTFTSILEEILIEYHLPTFSAFSVGQTTPIEVGTTLSGSKTFTWTTTNSSNVTTNSVDIVDVTLGANLVTNIPNDGSENVAITSNQLNANNATQVWRATATNTETTNFQSSDFTVTAKFVRFYGAASATPTNSTEVRALSESDFQTDDENTFILETGTGLTKFVIALPPSRTIVSVIDLNSVDITSEYVLQGTISVLDAGGTSRTYNLYEMNIGTAYSTSHQHSITTA